MEQAGILESKAGEVRLLRPDELPEDWDPAADRRLPVWEVARRQLDAEVPPTPAPVPEGQGPQPGPGPDGTEPPPPPEKKGRRFHGAVTLDATRVGRDAGQIADEVISQSE